MTWSLDIVGIGHVRFASAFTYSVATFFGAEFSLSLMCPALSLTMCFASSLCTSTVC